MASVSQVSVAGITASLRIKALDYSIQQLSHRAKVRVEHLPRDINATKGDISKKAEFEDAILKAKIDSPRGTITISKSHNPIQDIYLREVVGKENKFKSVASKSLADPARGCNL